MSVNGLTITNVSVYPVSNSQGRLRAVVRLVLNDSIQLTNLRIYAGSNGLFVSYPVESYDEGADFRQIFYPTSKEFREYVENAILKEYEAIGGEA